VTKYAALSSDRDIALAALDRLRVDIDADERQCADCGVTWYLVEPVREYFRARGLREPVRCKSCRETRKAALETRGLR
jgi:hypothetical protein